jgi:hypothetical protein
MVDRRALGLVEGRQRLGETLGQGGRRGGGDGGGDGHRNPTLLDIHPDRITPLMVGVYG